MSVREFEGWAVKLRVKRAKGYGPIISMRGGFHGLYPTRREARDVAAKAKAEHPVWRIATPVRVCIRIEEIPQPPRPR